MVDLVPYTEAMNPSKVMALFDRTVNDDLVDIVFYDGMVQTPGEFLQMVQSSVLFYVMGVKGKVVGYTWLNRFENHTARHHFCVFKEFWGQSIDFGKSGLSQIMNMKDADGNYIFDLLTGFVPAWNQRAINFSLKCGGKTHGTIPNAIFNGKTQQSEDAVFIYYTRGAE